MSHSAHLQRFKFMKFSKFRQSRWLIVGAIHREVYLERPGLLPRPFHNIGRTYLLNTSSRPPENHRAVLIGSHELEPDFLFGFPELDDIHHQLPSTIWIYLSARHIYHTRLFRFLFSSQCPLQDPRVPIGQTS